MLEMIGTDNHESDLHKLWNLIKGDNLAPDTVFHIADKFPSLAEEAKDLLPLALARVDNGK